MFCYIAIRKYVVIAKIDSHQILGWKICSIIDTSEIPPIFFNGHSFLRPNENFASENKENWAHSYLWIVKVSVEHDNWVRKHIYRIFTFDFGCKAIVQQAQK